MSVVAIPATRSGLSNSNISTLESLYGAADAVNFTPGWIPRNKPILWAEPRPTFMPAHWSYEDAKAGLDAAGHLIDVALAERRNLDPSWRARAVASPFIARAARHHRRQGILFDR
jgi:gentisate 1,2-dioxygenase